MLNTPKGLRLQIGIFGKRNVGKSSILNAIVKQDVAIVSDFPGTTTDPVDKAMELQPLGPVLLIDTAGFDDDAAGIGEKRVERTRKVIDRCDMALLVCTAENRSQEEEDFAAIFKERNIPCIVICNKTDIQEPDQAFQDRLAAIGVPLVSMSVKTGKGLESLREKLIELAPEGYLVNRPMLGDLTQTKKPVLLITPIDKEAPKGRLIMPEVQAIRDALDHEAWCAVVKDNAIQDVLDTLKEPPVLAVTDSQVFGPVSKAVPEGIPLTSFSILMARMKGDLNACAAGAAAISKLRSGDKILIAEGCSHHPIAEDIGRVKLPRWLKEYTKQDLEFVHVQGQDFPDDLSPFALVIHCGACTFNRRGVLSRILQCERAGVPFTNYGVAIAFLHGILERALSPFPEALKAYRQVKE
ncbi:MAG: [Lentisphaeria bacterium]|nr:[FeFe] hydrogenase H-cluster maturation GTPase HydF [Lentisphaeria bacterium]